MLYKNYISSTIFSILLAVMVSCSSKSNKEGNEEEEVLPEDIVELRYDQVKLANIEFGSLEKRQLSNAFKASGIVSVSPQNHATVCTQMGGFVKDIYLFPGKSVSKGQKLATLENQDYIAVQQEFLETKSKLEYAKAEFDRHNELYKDDVYSQKNVEQIKTDYQCLKVQLKALEQKLVLIGIVPSNLNEDNISRTIDVLSPISGYVQDVKINIGKFLNPSDVLFEIVNSEKLFIELTLFEKDADKVVKGQKVHFFINNETEQHAGEIYQTAKTIGSDKTFMVYASVTSTCNNLLPGMYVNAVIEADKRVVIAVPADAIVSFDDKNFIFIFEKNKEEDGNAFTEYRIIEIQKGITDNDYTEIILPEGFDYTKTKVVVTGVYNLLSAKKNAGEMAC
jgi:membrane fusion protein, heavy metal efflux system